MVAERYRFDLPYPPSLNRYYRHVGGRTLISRDGRAYRRRVTQAVARLHLHRLVGRLGMRIVTHQPDRKRRDLDNTLKAMLDALEHAGVYEDDGQIDVLTVDRGSVDRQSPHLDVEVWQIR